MRGGTNRTQPLYWAEVVRIQNARFPFSTFLNIIHIYLSILYHYTVSFICIILYHIIHIISFISLCIISFISCLSWFHGRRFGRIALVDWVLAGLCALEREIHDMLVDEDFYFCFTSVENPWATLNSVLSPTGMTVTIHIRT